MEILDFLDRPIAYHRCFVRVTGSVAGAVFLSQLLYWSKRVPDGRDGWLWKTGKNWNEETGLRRGEQESVRKKLLSLGVIEEKRRGIPARMYFRLNTTRLFSLLNSPDLNIEQHKSDGEDDTNLNIEIGNLDCRNDAKLNDESNNLDCGDGGCPGFCVNGDSLLLRHPVFKLDGKPV